MGASRRACSDPSCREQSRASRPPPQARHRLSKMADNVQLYDPAMAHAADTEYFVRRGMNKGYQLFSFLAPPVYIAFAVSRYGRSHLTVNRLLRATWVGGASGTCRTLFACTPFLTYVCNPPNAGIVTGGGFEYVRSAYSNPENVRNRRIRATYDVRLCPASCTEFNELTSRQTASLRADDHSTIGGVLCAVVTPALFWKRANAINCECVYVNLHDSSSRQLQ